MSPFLEALIAERYRPNPRAGRKDLADNIKTVAATLLDLCGRHPSEIFALQSLGEYIAA